MMCSKKKRDVDTTKLSSSMSYCFLQISIGGEMMKDKIIIEFDTLNRPKTCRSFLALCTSSITTRKSSPQQTYRGSEFHRIVPGMCVQGGDFEKFDGTGGFSPLYGHHWEDEHINTNSSNKNSSNKNNKHDQAGIVSMANPGKKNTNGSQFFITLKPTPHLDANHVVFGRVISGMDTTVQKMADVERDNKNRPVSLQRIVIEDCGLHAQLQQQSTLTDGKKMRKKKKNKKRRRKDDDDNDTSGVDDTDNDSDNDDDRRRSRKRHRKKKESRKIDRKKRERKHRRRYQDNDENSSDNDVSSYCSSSTNSSSSSNSYDSDDRKQKRKRYKKKSKKGARGKHKRSKKTKK